MHKRAKRGLGCVWLFAIGCSVPLSPLEHSGGEQRPQEYVSTVASPEAEDEFIGVVVADEMADIGPTSGGEVLTVEVRAGQRVVAGETLAKLDTRQAAENLRMAEASLRRETAALGEAKVDREQAASRLEEVKKLARADAAAAKSVEDARFQLRRAKAAQERASADVAQWRAKCEQLRRELSDTQLRAPFSGVVAARLLDPGDMAGPDAPVVRLISSDTLWVRFAVPPQRLEQVRVGAAVAMQLGASRARQEATIRQIGAETDVGSQFVFVDAEIIVDALNRPNLQPGTPAWVRLPSLNPGRGSHDTQ